MFRFVSFLEQELRVILVKPSISITELLLDRLFVNVLTKTFAWFTRACCHYLEPTYVSFSSCQRNLIKTFQIEAMIALITKMTLVFS